MASVAFITFAAGVQGFQVGKKTNKDEATHSPPEYGDREALQKVGGVHSVQALEMVDN